MKLDLLAELIENTKDRPAATPPTPSIEEENEEAPNSVSCYFDGIKGKEHFKEVDRRSYEKLMNWD